MRVLSVAFAFALALATIATTSLAAPITQPSGLNPGDEYRLVFVTSTARDGTSGNIADYNAFATAAANNSPDLVALGTTWTAIASTGIDARDNTGTNSQLEAGVPVFNLADMLVASGNIALWGDDHSAAMSFDEYGIYRTGSVWTGTGAGGRGVSSWTLGTTNRQAMAGSIVALDTSWVSHGLAGLSLQLPVYAISDVLVAVPEPSTALLVSLGLIGLARRRP